MKIVRTDCKLHLPKVDAALRADGHELVFLPDGVAEDQLVAEVGDAGLILMCYTAIPERVIAAAPRLRGIVKYGVGIDAIDIPAATARGVPVVNIPEYGEETVAEGAFALMITLLRQLPRLDRAMKADGWAWPEPQWLGHDIAGKTIGVVGFGKIGRSFARMAGQGFRATMLGYDPGKAREDMAAAGVEKCEDLTEMLARSDVVSVHSVLNDATHHLIGKAEIAAMKPGAVLINAARGAIVDEIAMRDALVAGHLGGAALDVFSQEPLNRDDHPLAPLFEMENVILSPHLTFYTHEAMGRLEAETLERCREIIDGRPVQIKSRDPRLRQDLPNIERV
jgi:D-3-phosphoglycerate dehydrogenase